MTLKYVVQAFLILLMSFLLLLGLQWLYPHSSVLQEHFKNSQLLTYYFEYEEPTDTLNLIDSTLLAQLDTLDADTLTVQEDSVSLPALKAINDKEIETDSFQVPAFANLENLEKFFASLSDSSQRRIGYWGDSMIEGDLISMTLRRKLQKEFGGEGVGFVPMISFTAGFRRTVNHVFGGGWRYFSLVKTPKKKDAPYGISGEYAMATVDSTGTKAWAEWKAPKKAEKWSRVRFFYGKGDGKTQLSMKHNYRHDSLIALKDTFAFNQLSWNDTGITRFRINLLKSGQTPLYGVSLESGNGIWVDNFNLRGNSGMPMNKIPYEVMRGFDKSLGYDLIILQFGSNVVSEKTTKYHWYESAMLRVVRHYQQCFPNASILILGLGDKSYKNEDGEMVTNPSVKRVLKAQYKIALKTGVAFYSIYSAMGGDGSMVEWADAEKPLANKDYTHFNFRGAEKVGSLLYHFLMENYLEYRKTHTVAH
ncbi:MAG: hypothetical protein EP332_09560 [Bacteroidetes bacterium]|nr:MAG: hypothetical protein EP332_09560 [Bacteroidota bacterium]